MTKRMLEMEWAMSVETAVEAEAVAQALCMTTEDFKRASAPSRRSRSRCSRAIEMALDARSLRLLALLRRRPSRAPKLSRAGPMHAAPRSPHTDVDAACRARVRALGEAGFLRAVVPAAYGGTARRARRAHALPRARDPRVP
jgi:hypothetical protein